MSARADHISIAKTPLWRRRQFWRVALPTLAVLSVIAAGLIVFDAVDGSNGVDVRGRSHTLKVCYRTSHQIRRVADRLLPTVLRDTDGLEDERRSIVSVFEGPCVKLPVSPDCTHVES